MKKPAPYRNRTLVLNSATGSGGDSSANSEDGHGSSDKDGTAWVVRTDRHMQLINASVYEKDAQSRAKAIEQTQLQKQRLRDDHERAKLRSHLSSLAHNRRATSASGSSTVFPQTYQVVIEGIPFAVAKNGSKLVKVPGAYPSASATFAPTSRPPFFEDSAYPSAGDPNPPSSTPKTAIIGGVKFYRSKNGNLYRHAVVKAQRYVTRGQSDSVALTLRAFRRAATVKKIDEPCKIFSTTGIYLDPPSPVWQRGCCFRTPGTSTCRESPNSALCFCFLLFVPSPCAVTNHVPAAFLRPWTTVLVWTFFRSSFSPYLGSCSKGPFCRYLHNPAKVAVCKDFLLKGDCAHGSDCDLSHDLTPERTPFCLHYAKGNCTNPQCPYTHSQVSAGAPVCRPFGIYGYCSLGADCTERHVFECPDFSNTGVCKTKNCKLPHRERASFMRRANQASDAVGGDDDDADADMVDASSDESVNSDDVDSDEVDEFVGADGEDAGLDFVTQKDYIEI